jgi:3-hydroxybutyryl-CoA dehydrogenase
MQKINLRNIAIIGAGLMGLGIGVEYARFGYNVKLYNTNNTSSKLAIKHAHEIIDLMIEAKLITLCESYAILKCLNTTCDINDATRGADLVVESVPENLQLKQKIFTNLDEICPPTTILCTDTSGLRVTDIARYTRHPERILATHYTQPPHFVPLVEVVPGEKTDPDIIIFVAGMLKKMHKMVVITKDTPQFIQNRIQGAIGRECQLMVDEGLATPETIDDVICFGFGRRMAYSGYFKRLDLVGLDFFCKNTGNVNYHPWKSIVEHVEHGELGMKTGKGFHEWPEQKRKMFLHWYHTELIRLMKQDLERGDI